MLTAPEHLRFSPLAAASVCFSVDNDLVRAGRAAHPATRCVTAATRPKAGAALSFSLGRHACAAPRQVYEPFFADFGPLNMSCAFRFCQRALAALEARVPAHTLLR